MCGAKLLISEEGERRQLGSGQSGSHLDSNVVRKQVDAFHGTLNAFGEKNRKECLELYSALFSLRIEDLCIKKYLQSNS